MDPLSITVACVSLAATVGKVSLQIHDFVRKARDARRDLDSVSRELGSIKMVLEVLAEDAANPEIMFPPYLENKVSGIIANCSLVVVQIKELLDKHSGGGLRKGVKWAVGGREEMDKLRVSLEAHKSALEITLEIVNISITRDIKTDTSKLRDDTAVILDDTTTIKLNTGRILAEIERLHAQLPNTAGFPESHPHMLERYLDSLTAYAESKYLNSVKYSSKDSDGEKDEVLGVKEDKLDSSKVNAPENKVKKMEFEVRNQNAMATPWRSFGASIPPIEPILTLLPNSQVFNVLLLGQSQNGKSSFINKMLKTASKSEGGPRVGAGSIVETRITKYEVSLSTSTYKLIDETSGKAVVILADESLIMDEMAYLRSTTVHPHPAEPDAPHVRVNFIDTVGFDDVNDLNDLNSIFAFLAKMSNRNKPEGEHISAILYFHSCQAPISYSFLEMFLDRSKYLPSKFKGLAMVNTHFGFESWYRHTQSDSSRQLYPDSTLSERYAVMQKRYDAFSDIVGRPTQHFFIDSYPSPHRPFEDFLTLNTITDILRFISAQQPFPIEDFTQQS